MTLVAGIDGGLNGAIAIYDTTTPDRVVDLIDIPVLNMIVGGKKRHRIDRHGLFNHFEYLKMLDVKLVVVEAVGARPSQSGMFVFGYTIGAIEMAIYITALPMESVDPRVWKRMYKLKGKTVDDDHTIIGVADAKLPGSRQLWRGPKGGMRVDRAEAALIAKFAGDHMLHLKPTSDFITQGKIAYDMVE